MKPSSRRDSQGALSANGRYERYALRSGALDNNTYLLVCVRTRDAVLIDACAPADEIIALASHAAARVRYLLMTHGHQDHWTSLGAVRERLRASVGIHLDDVDMLPLTPNFALSDTQRINFGATDLQVIATPGHTPGSVSFYGDRQLFSGDTLFAGGPGSVKPPLGNHERLIASLRDRVFRLPDEVMVYPGHGEPTSIGAEKPHLEEWAARGE
ncbi:MAG TPA: MBL fold metallo-hydrolase [Ktedonobacterales bacterium]